MQKNAFLRRIYFPTQNLFPDAEFAEDVAEDFVGGKCAAGDGAELVNAFAQVHREQVAGKADAEAVLNAADGVERVEQIFVVARVGHGDVFEGLFVDLRGFDEHLAQLVDAEALFGGNAANTTFWALRSARGNFRSCGNRGRVRARWVRGIFSDGTVADSVDFIQNDNELFVVGNGNFVKRNIVKFGGVDDPENDLGFVYGAVAAGNAEAFDGVGGFAQAGRIEETEQNAVDADAVFDDVARGAVNVADDGFFFAHQGIEQGGFARVGAADDGHGNAVFDGVSYGE